MWIKVFIFSCACSVALALGNGQYYSTKTKKAPQQFTDLGGYQQPHQPKQQYVSPAQNAAPSPYAFSYEADGSGRQESSDGSGVVTGSYTVMNEDGSKRLVKYIADDKGFRAHIDTDEPGTKSDNPADIQLKSAAKAPRPQLQMSKPASKFSAGSVQQKTRYQAPLSQKPVMQYSQGQSMDQPAPYSFSYKSQMEDGSSAHSESSDGSGKVVGTYSMANMDGRQRTVDYTADQSGFKASVDTNEFGTKSDSPADVKFFSSAPVQGPASVAPKAPMSFPAPRQQASSGAGHYSSYSSQNKIDEEHYQPIPAYAFDYTAQLDDGSSSRSESSDGAGTIMGSYNLAVADGRQRAVEYTADKGGFRATVKTNEFGTKSDSPADVMFYSTATDEEPAPYKSPMTSYRTQSQSSHAPVAQRMSSSAAGSFKSSYQTQQQQPIQFSQSSFGAAEQKPSPYSFDYQSQLDQGSSARQESADSSGKVTGSYSLTHMDGSQRTVEYTADDGGFRAKVHTNEFGTKSDSPADVSFQSSAPLNAPAGQMQYSVGGPSKQKPSSAGSTYHSGAKFSGQQQQQIQFGSHAQKPSYQVQQQVQQVQQYVPAPYSFNYDAEGSARQESSDSSGKVTGSYSVTNEDGSTRIVEYIADADGFRANVKTDEPGTKSDNPANVVLLSSAPEPKPYFPPQQSAHKSSAPRFPAKTNTPKSSMISQELIY